MTQPNRKRQRRTFTLNDGAYEQLTRLAEAEDGNRSRFIEALIGKAEEFAEQDPERTFTLGDAAYEQLAYIAEMDGASTSVALEVAIHRSARFREEYEQLDRERREVQQARDQLQEWARLPRPPWWKIWAKQPALPDLPQLGQGAPPRAAELAAAGQVIDAPGQPG